MFEHKQGFLVAVLFFILIAVLPCGAQNSIGWLPKESLFPEKPLDYREAQFSGS